MTELTPDPRNARLHPDRNKETIRRSLEEVGPFRSIAVDGDDIIRAGNGVYEQAQALGLSVRIIDAAPNELIAVRRPDLHGARAERAALLDNRAGELAVWDADVLAELERDHAELLDGLWDEGELRQLLAQATNASGEVEEIATPDPSRGEQLRAQWQTATGQLWEIPSLTRPGQAHRLLCGDSTNAEDVQRLMDGKRAVLFATDPPYLVDYDGTNHPQAWNAPDTKNKDWSETYHDWDDSAQGEELYDGFIREAIAHAIVTNAAWYCWHASKCQAMLQQMWEKHGAFVHQQIIWYKDRPVLTRSWYMWQHEPCFFGWIRGERPTRCSDTYPSSVWSIPTIAPGTSTDHPTSKPLEVFAIPMRQHTAPGDLCYEPFSGSGSQHVAGEQLGRIVYGLEKQPVYVAVILERLATLGLTPRLVA